MTSMKELFGNISPFPSIFEGNLSHGTQVRQPSFCRKCKELFCCNSVTNQRTHYLCPYGFSYYQVEFLNCRFIINGLIVTDKNHEISGPRRKELKPYWVHSTQLISFFENLVILSDAIEMLLENERARSVSFLHDIRSSVSTVLYCCQEVIALTPGEQFTDKINNAKQELKGLYQAINLLNEQLDLADIIINPDAISYGPRNSSSINGFLYKMVKIFEPRAKSIKNNIILKGYTSRSISAYNSFQFVPLVLLDNAIKYSYRNRDIYVNIKDEADCIKFTISSFGEVVPDTHIDLIFEKYVRGPNVERIQSHGMGLGLYIAKKIIDLHGFSIHYEKSSVESLVGNNDFVVSIPKVHTAQPDAGGNGE